MMQSALTLMLQWVCLAIGLAGLLWGCASSSDSGADAAIDADITHREFAAEEKYLFKKSERGFVKILRMGAYLGSQVSFCSQVFKLWAYSAYSEYTDRIQKRGLWRPNIG